MKCLNIIGYGSNYQMMCPFYEVETGKLIHELFQEKWVSWAGRPVEIILDPAQANMSEAFTGAQEMAGVRVLSIAAEAHNQPGRADICWGPFFRKSLIASSPFPRNNIMHASEQQPTVRMKI